MDVALLNKCTALTAKLEKHPFYGLLSDQAPEFRAIKVRLITRSHKTPDEWVNDLCELLNSISKAENSDKITKYAALGLITWLERKRKKLLYLCDWKNRVCTIYNKLVDLLRQAPPDWPMDKKIVWMQTTGIDIDVSETELVDMKKVIESELNDDEREMVGRMIMAMEQDTLVKGDSLIFDLAKLNKETLLAVRTFVRKREKMATQGKGRQVNLYKE